MKLRKVLPLVALATTVTFTSCIKNEESDGIKAMRQAQAALINAKATAETTMATAEAAYQNALAALKQAEAETELAQADYQKLLNDAKQLQNELLAAQNEAEKSRITAELEVTIANLARQKTEAEAALAVAAKQADIDLNNAEIALQQSMRALAAEMAKADVENPTLDEYMSKYQDVLDELLALRSTIIDDEKTLAEEQINKQYDYETAPKEEIIAGLQDDITGLETEKTMYETFKTRYEAASDDTSAINDLILDAMIDKADLEKQIQAKKIEIDTQEKAVADQQVKVDDAQQAMNDAQQAMNDANDAYEQALEYKGYYDIIKETTVSGQTVFISNDLIIMLDKEKVMLSNGSNLAQGNYFSEKYYQDIINDNVTYTDDERDDATEKQKLVVALAAYYASEIGGTSVPNGVQDKLTAYFTAKDAYIASVTAHDTEVDNLAGENDALAALTDAKDMLETEWDYLDDYIDVLDGNKQDIAGTIQDIEDAIKGLDDKIKGVEDDIATTEKEIAIIEKDADYQDSYIDYLQKKVDNNKEKETLLQTQADKYKALIDAEIGG